MIDGHLYQFSGHEKLIVKCINNSSGKHGSSFFEGIILSSPDIEDHLPTMGTIKYIIGELRLDWNKSVFKEITKDEFRDIRLKELGI